MARSNAEVYLDCTGDWVDVNKVKFLNIEEDFSGRDVETFECPECHQEHKSLIRVRR